MIPESVIISLNLCCVFLCASDPRQVRDSSAECGSLVCECPQGEAGYSMPQP